jgi:hypothetical protein
MRLTRGNESIRCETVCSKIVYSVRIGPLQPNRSVPISFEYPVTIRIDNNDDCALPLTQEFAGSSPVALPMLWCLRMSGRFISSLKKFYGSR